MADADRTYLSYCDARAKADALATPSVRAAYDDAFALTAYVNLTKRRAEHCDAALNDAYARHASLYAARLAH